MGETRIGVSGWLYPEWRKVFYPDGLRRQDELAYIGSLFNAVELNGPFYSLQRPESYRSWRDATPDGFVFAVKGSRFITHMKRLTEPRVALANYFASGILALGDKLGPILWQLPPQLTFDRERLAAFFDALPRDTEAAARLARRHDQRVSGRAYLRTDARRPIRYALEVRHPSFLDERFIDLLVEHDIASCVADTAERFPMIDRTTSDLVYVRLHGDTELYRSGYSDETLQRWAMKIRAHRRKRDVFVFFDNTAHGHAPRDALSLAQKCGVRWPAARAARAS